MTKTDGAAKKSRTDQPEEELRPFYFPKDDVTIMAKDQAAALKELPERLKTLDEIKKAQAENGDQE